LCSRFAVAFVFAVVVVFVVVFGVVFGVGVAPRTVRVVALRRGQACAKHP
jgi:hypothetical protein